jgi:hypothetical protein
VAEQPINRIPLRQLLTMAEKSSRDVAERLHTDLLTQVADFRDLSRPVRRRSSYPSMRSLAHSLEKLLKIGEEVNRLAAILEVQLTEIRERSQREKASRQS